MLWWYWIVAFFVAAGVSVGIYFLVDGLTGSTTASPTPTATVEDEDSDGDSVEDPVFIGGSGGGVDFGVSEFRVYAEANGFVRAEWNSSNTSGDAFVLTSANAGTMYSGTLSSGFFNEIIDVRLSLLQYDTLQLKAGETLLEETDTPIDANFIGSAVYYSANGEAGTTNRTLCFNYTGNTVMYGEQVDGHCHVLKRLSTGEWSSAETVGDTGGGVIPRGGVSGDGTTLIYQPYQINMGVSPRAYDWNSTSNTWTSASAGLSSTIGGLFSGSLNWEGLKMASIESHSPSESNNNFNDIGADALFVRRRTDKSSSWGAPTKMYLPAVVPHMLHDVMMSHDGNLVLVSHTGTGILYYATENGPSSYEMHGTLAITTSGTGVLGPATKCIMSSHVADGNLVSSRYTIDDFDAATPTWTLERTCNLTSIASVTGYTGTLPYMTEQYNENMTVMMLTDITKGHDTSVLNGNANAATDVLTNAGQAWMFRREETDTEWTFEANVFNHQPMNQAYFGYRARIAMANNAPGIVILDRGNSSITGSNLGVTVY